MHIVDLHTSALAPMYTRNADGSLRRLSPPRFNPRSLLVSVMQVIDASFLQYTIGHTIASSGQSVMLLFAFEYVILVGGSLPALWLWLLLASPS